MSALAWVVPGTLATVLYFLYRGWRGDTLLDEATAYGRARTVSRAGSHLDQLPDEAADDAVRCLQCGTANEPAFSFCRQCETPLC